MMADIRRKTSAYVASGIIGFIAFVFIFSGVFSPKATRGLHEGAVAGKVNGESISLGEYQRELSKRMEFFKQLAGGKVSEEQLKMFRVYDAVFNELVSRKLMRQAAEDTGMIASDEEVRRRIMEIPAFQKDGKFDRMTYERVLGANNYTPGGFERVMREDLSVQQWGSYFRDRSRVSEEEARKQFLLDNDKRDVKYVLLTPENGAKGITISDSEVQAFLGNTAKANLAKARYEAEKDSLYKGKSFDEVRQSIARNLISSEKSGEAMKINEKLATQVAAVMTASKASDAKVNSLLKPFGAEVRSTGLISRQSRFIPGVGEAHEVMKDVFAEASPQAKVYTVPAGKLIALVAQVQKPDLSKLQASLVQIKSQLTARKERELYDAWMKKLTEKAKIDKNPDVVGGRENQDES